MSGCGFQSRQFFLGCWQLCKITPKQETLKVSDPVLPRRRKTPARSAVGTEAGHHPASRKELFRQHYFECLDLIIVSIKDRFDQPGIHTLKYLEIFS